MVTIAPIVAIMYCFVDVKSYIIVVVGIKQFYLQNMESIITMLDLFSYNTNIKL